MSVLAPAYEIDKTATAKVAMREDSCLRQNRLRLYKVTLSNRVPISACPSASAMADGRGTFLIACTDTTSRYLHVFRHLKRASAARSGPGRYRRLCFELRRHKQASLRDRAQLSDRHAWLRLRGA